MKGGGGTINSLGSTSAFMNPWKLSFLLGITDYRRKQGFIIGDVVKAPVKIGMVYKVKVHHKVRVSNPLYPLQSLLF